MEQPRNTSDFIKMKNILRTQHKSMSTEKSYLTWITKFYKYHKKHPRDMGEKEIQSYLTHLAIDKKVAKSTQNQAFHAILFFYRHVLDREIQGINAVRSKKQEKVPEILSQSEVKTFLNSISPASCHCLALLYYGSGLRLMEGVRLRIKDINFKQRHLLIHDGKGHKNRIVPLMPESESFLQAQITETERIWKRDVSEGFGEVYIPHALSKKYPYASTSWQWQYVFVSKRRGFDPRDGKEKRQHINPATIQAAIRRTSARLFNNKRITAHCLRHSIATHLIEMGHTLKEVSEFLGHANTRTTERYIHLAKKRKPFFSLDDLED